MAPSNQHEQVSEAGNVEGVADQMQLETRALLELIRLGRKEIAEGRFALASRVLNELGD